MSVTNGRDDLRVGVKCQANPEIAGSPRNALRCSVVRCPASGSALLGRGPVEGTDPRQTPNGRGSRAAVRLRGLSFVVETGTAETVG